MVRHKSTAYLNGCSYYGENTVTKQFRHVLRLALACNEANVPYDLDWSFQKSAASRMAATIRIEAPSIPAVKSFPKPPRLVSREWKPRYDEAVYELEAMHTAEGRKPAFVISHSSGLSLICATTTGEWGDGEGDADPKGKNWSLTHAASGKSFGVCGPIGKVTEALLFAARQSVDWTQPIEELGKLPHVRNIANQVVAEYGATKSQRMVAKQRLAA
jgi:hypothetical protein